APGLRSAIREHAGERLVAIRDLGALIISLTRSRNTDWTYRIRGEPTTRVFLGKMVASSKPEAVAPPVDGASRRAENNTSGTAREGEEANETRRKALRDDPAAIQNPS